MKTLIFIVALLLGQQYLIAQQITFFKYWGNNSSDIGFDAKQLKDSGYIVLGVFADSSAWPQEGLLMRTDKDGNLLKLKTVCGLTSTIYKTTDSSIFLFGGYANNNVCSNNGVFLYEINYDLDTIWHKDFGYGFSSYSDVGINEHYVISGGYVSRLDSNWNLKWTVDYSTLGANLNLIKATPDGGFVVAGLNHYPYYTKKTYAVLKCDSNGVQQWFHTYGNNPYDPNSFNQYPPTSILVLPDSNYIITTHGYWGLFKVDKDSGDRIFKRSYFPAFYGIDHIEPIANKRYVANVEGPLTLLDSSFKVISYGSYRTIGGWYQDFDGGFYGSGYAANSNFPSLQYNAVALLKTDSLGFIYNVQGIEQVQQESGISVYPNPTINELTISNSQLANGKAVMVNVYDVMGKEKLFQKLTATNSKLKMDVSSLVSGLYFLRVEENGKVYNTKFVKE